MYGSVVPIIGNFRSFHVFQHFAQTCGKAWGMRLRELSLLCMCEVDKEGHEYHISSKSRCSEILFQGPVWCSDNLRAASAEINKCGVDNQHCSPFVCMNNTHAHHIIAVDPLPCSEILRVAFIWMICLKVW